MMTVDDYAKIVKLCETLNTRINLQQDQMKLMQQMIDDLHEYSHKLNERIDILRAMFESGVTKITKVN